MGGVGRDVGAGAMGSSDLYFLLNMGGDGQRGRGEEGMQRRGQGERAAAEAATIASPRRDLDSKCGTGAKETGTDEIRTREDRSITDQRMA